MLTESTSTSHGASQEPRALQEECYSFPPRTHLILDSNGMWYFHRTAGDQGKQTVSASAVSHSESPDFEVLKAGEPRSAEGLKT